jgi:hypothetical protein
MMPQTDGRRGLRGACEKSRSYIGRGKRRNTHPINAICQGSTKNLLRAEIARAIFEAAAGASIRNGIR